MPMFVPTDDELVLTKCAPGKTEGGILMPDVDDDAKDRNGEYLHPVGRGVVVAIGPGRYNPRTNSIVPAMPVRNPDQTIHNMGEVPWFVAGVKVGDVVYYQKRVAYEIRHEGTTYLVVDAQRVLGVIPQA